MFVSSVYVTFSWEIHAANLGAPVVFVTVRKLLLYPTAFPGASHSKLTCIPGKLSPADTLGATAGREIPVAFGLLVMFSAGNYHNFSKIREAEKKKI